MAINAFTLAGSGSEETSKQEPLIQRVPRLAILPIFISAGASIVATITIIAFFALGQPWGTLNDITYSFMALSMVPMVLTIHSRLRESRPRASMLAAAFGLISIVGFMVSSLTVTLEDLGILTLGWLEPYPGLGPLGLGVVFFVAIDVWICRLDTSFAESEVPKGVLMSFIGITGIGYPLWAVWLGRKISTREI